MSKEQAENNKPDNSVNEPQPGYGMKLTIFNSFEEMNEFDAKESARFSPLENLQQTTALIKRIYAEELKKPFSDFVIYNK